MITDHRAFHISKTQWLRAGAGAVAGVGVLLLVVFRFDFQTLLSAMRHASAPKILSSILLFLIGMAARGIRLSWIGHGRAHRWIGCSRGVILGLGVNSFIPLRIGEVIKALVISRRGGMDLIQAGTAVVIERFLDVSFFALWISAASALNAPMFSQWLGRWLESAPAPGGPATTHPQVWFWSFVMVAAAAVLLRSKSLRIALSRAVGQIRSRLAEFWPSLAGRLGWLYGWTTLIWLLDLAFVLITASAFGLEISPAHGFFLEMVLAAAYASSVSPGALGLYEVMGLWALKAMGYPEAAGASFLLAAHGLIYIFMSSLFIAAAASEISLIRSLRPSAGKGSALGHTQDPPSGAY